MRLHTDSQHNTRVMSESWGDQIHLALHTRPVFPLGPFRLVQRYGDTVSTTYHLTWRRAFDAFHEAVVNADMLVAVIQNGLPYATTYPYNHETGE